MYVLLSTDPPGGDVSVHGVSADSDPPHEDHWDREASLLRTSLRVHLV